MPDQAHDLRQLAVRRRAAPPKRVGRPAVLAVAGGKGGVGTTTVGLNLALAMSESGRNVVFVDADARGADAALLCRLEEERSSLADVLAGRRAWDEALLTIPGGLRLAVGGSKWNELNGTQATLAERFLESVADGRLDAELIVADVGNTMRGSAAEICRQADAVLMITTPSPAAAMNTFSAIRTLASDAAATHAASGTFYLLVNMAPHAAAADAVHYRLAWAARRLLGRQLRSAGCLPAVENLPADGLNEQFYLNIRALSVDAIGRQFVSELVSNWRSPVEFDGCPPTAVAEPLEMDF